MTDNLTRESADQEFVADLTSEEFIQNPYPFYKEAAMKCPVFRDPNVAVGVAGREALERIAYRTEEFSSNVAGADGPRHMGLSPEPIPEDIEELLKQYHPVVPALFAGDPPEQTTQHKLVARALSRRRVRQLEPQSREIVTQLIDGFIEKGHVKFTSEFTVPMPLMMISDILGVSREDMADFKHWSDEMLAGNMSILSNDRRREVARAVIDFHQYFLPRIEDRRTNPREDLLSWLVNTEIDGRRLQNEELLPIISQILLAGHETQTFVMSSAMVILCRDPKLLQRLRDDLSLLPKFFDEVIRWDPPVVGTFRRCTRDTDIDGVPVKEGDLVMPMWGSAGWDPAVFPDPEKFDMDRPNADQHMDFGHGPHYCVGFEVAKMNLAVAFEELLTRLEDIELDEENSDLTRLPTFSMHGLTEVAIRFKPGTRSAS
ncbi:cytochrome P450 [Mycolicibacterium thermoresistibile]